ncbi:MAG TPA: MFS transporter [Thermotogota bacterium]|nr:MFS transporter [Thermotogota bacterium]HPJ87882.1 MFS transporter [Thermotogota bacterium]HPR94975.1 MFS transporter [Thermotogota bacterium]
MIVIRNEVVKRDKQFYKFAMYGFLKNLRFFEPFMILFLKEQGFSFLNIGILFTIRELTTNITEIPTGFLADLVGRKLTMILSMIAYIISFIIFFFTKDLILYILAMLFFGFAEALRSGTHKSLILSHLKLNHIEDQKVKYYGLTRSYSQKGSAVNSIIAASLVFFTGSYRIVFLAAVVPYVLNLVNLMTYPSELDNVIRESRKNKATFKELFKPLLELGKISNLRVYLNSSLFSAVFKSTKDYLQPVLEGFAISLPLFITMDSEKKTALILGITYFVIYILTSYSAQYSYLVLKKAKNLRHTLNTTFMAGILIVLFAGIFNLISLEICSIIMFLLMFLLQNLRRPLNVSLISDIIPEEKLSTGLSIESQLSTLMIALFSPIIGFLMDKFGIGWGLILFSIVIIVIYPFIKLKTEGDQDK